MRSSKAVVFAAENHVEVRNVTLREPQADDVIIETLYSSISAGTEKMILEGKMPDMPMMKFPVVPGYETVGRIIKKGDNVTAACIDKFVYVSGSFGYTDVNAAFGGASQYIVSPFYKLTFLDGIDDLTSALALPLGATALHIVDLAGVTGKSVLVLGQGAVGLLVVQLSKLFNASEVVATDMNSVRLGLSDADIKLNPATDKLKDLSREFDAIIDCTGKMAAIEESLDVAKMRSKIILGGYYERLNIEYMKVFMKELQLISVKQWSVGDLDRIVALLRNKSIPAKKIFTHHRSFADVLEAYQIAFNDANCVKMIVNWAED